MIAYHPALRDDGIEPCVFGIGKFHQPVEHPLGRRAVGIIYPAVLFVLPVVALLQQREAAAADHQILQRDPLAAAVQYRCDDDAAAAPQQRFGQRDHEVEPHLAVAFGNGAHPRYDRHLLDAERRDALPVGEGVCLNDAERIGIAVSRRLRPVLRSLRAPFGCGVRQRYRRLPLLHAARHPAAEQ